MQKPLLSSPIIFSRSNLTLKNHNSSLRVIAPTSSPPLATFTESETLGVNSIPSKPIEGQKTGTSGIRKKALLNSLPPEDFENGLLVLGGDYGRYFNKEAAQGTGSAGATVRVYIEQYESDVSKHDMDAQIALKTLIETYSRHIEQEFINLAKWKDLSSLMFWQEVYVKHNIMCLVYYPPPGK